MRNHNSAKTLAGRLDFVQQVYGQKGTLSHVIFEEMILIITIFIFYINRMIYNFKLMNV